jgi:replicative DNA helicase
LPPDVVAVSVRLNATGRLAEIGGMGYLMQLITDTPTSVNAEVYARLVERAAARRALLQATETVTALALDGEKETDAVLAAAAAAINDVLLGHSTSGESIPIRDAVGIYLNELEDVSQEAASGYSGLVTGYPDLDHMLDGLMGLCVVGARPGGGKSALLASMVANVAARGKRVYLWSGEMPAAQITNRLIAGVARVDSSRVRRQLRPHGLDDQQHSEVLRAAAEIGTWKIVINDHAAITPPALRADIQRTQARLGGVDLVVIDYLGLMGSDINFKDNAYAKTSYFARALKHISSEMSVPVLCAAQLSRSVASRADKRPQMNDLRDSGEIEQAADSVLFPFRKMDSDPFAASWETDLIIAKNRHGATGTIPLVFRPEFTRFDNLWVDDV